MISTDFLSTDGMFLNRLSVKKMLGYGISMAAEPVNPLKIIEISFDCGWKPLPHMRYQFVGAASSRDISGLADVTIEVIK
jgi:hypothetical protein